MLHFGDGPLVTVNGPAALRRFRAMPHAIMRARYGTVDARAIGTLATRQPWER